MFDATWTRLERTFDGLFTAGCGGVREILAPRDHRSEFVCMGDGCILLTYPGSAVQAYYPWRPHPFKAPAKAVLMDLDGTSVKSESFWIWIIQQTAAQALGDSSFCLQEEDIPFVSGFSVSEHLTYCQQKYAIPATLEELRTIYFAITRDEMRKIIEGNGREGAYTVSEGLKEFLMALHERGIKLGLVTSGLYEKAMPEIISGFQQMNQTLPVLPEPLMFYDAVITAGTSYGHGQAGTLGELSAKPHPWLYREICEVGLGIHEEDFQHVIVLEDSSAGVMAGRSAGFDVIGMNDGNIGAAGLNSLLYAKVDHLLDALPLILGKEET